MTSEKDVKDQVKKILKRYGAWYTMPYQAGFSNRGVPDILACYQGKFIAIECKFGNRKPTALQEIQMKQIERAGGRMLLINEENIKEVERCLLTI